MRIVQVVDLIMYRNTDFLHQFDFIDLNISTYTFVSKIRDKNNNLIDEFTITKPTNFVVQLFLDETQTQDLSLETYYYDIIQTINNISEVIIKGTITVENTITNFE
jgi:hypothetical protein